MKKLKAIIKLCARRARNRSGRPARPWHVIAEGKGDFAAGIDIAKTAYEPSKGPAWAFDLLFKSQIAVSDWDGALGKPRHSAKTKTCGQRRGAAYPRSALYAAKAARLEKDGQTDAAVDAALRGAEMSPGFAPGAALAARLLTHNGQAKKAASILEKSWSRAPHPALALSYRDIFRTEPAKVRAKKLKSLTKTNPAHRESFILAAEEALRDGDAVGALQSLGSLLREEEPSARLCALASAAEDKLGNAVDARAWHIRAASAPIEADWSDLDPDGPAFKYEDNDWQRLITSYGETGELIHPRYEAHKRRRSVLSVNPAAPETKSAAPAEMETPPRPDDPGINLKSDDTEDLSQRLENLLDGGSKE